LPIDSPEPARASRAKSVYAAVGFLLGGVLLYFSVRGIDWPRVLHTARGAKPGLLVACFALCSLALLARAIRWRVLLSAESRVGIGDAFWATAAGYFGNTFLPARAGEIVRTLMITSRFPVSKPFVLTTALLERFADAIALVAISTVVLLTMPAPPGWLRGASKPFAILGLCGILAIVALPRLERQGRAILIWARIPESLKAKLIHILEQCLLGLRSFHDSRRLTAFSLLAAVIWSIDGIGTVIGARALGLVMPLPASFLLIAGLGLGSALPSTPGYVGIYQFVAVSILVPFGFDRTDAIAFILFSQALYCVIIGFWGALAFWRFRKMASAGDSEILKEATPLACSATVSDRL
jgi:uncharacterized protein (TIRG00374 family)